MLGLQNERGGRALNWIDKRLLGNTLGDKLRTQKARRRVTMLGIALSAAFGFALGHAAWAIIAPNPVSTLEKFLSALFWVALILTTLIRPLMQKAVASVVTLPDQTVDERQEQLFIDARAKALDVTQGLMLIAMLTGAGMLIATVAGHLPWSHPAYGGIPVYFGICGTLFVAGSLSPYLILAWQLPDEPDFDDECRHDG